MNIAKIVKRIGVAGSIFTLFKIVASFIFLSVIAIVLALFGLPWYIWISMLAFAILLLVLQIKRVKRIMSVDVNSQDSYSDTINTINKQKQGGFAFIVAIVIAIIIGLVFVVGYMQLKKGQDKGSQVSTQTAVKTILDCGKDIDCFIKAQKNKKDAKVKFVSVSNPFMATIMETKFYKKGNKYIYHQTVAPNEYGVDEYIEDFRAKASSEEVAKLNAMPREEIKARLESMKKWSGQALSMKKDMEKSCIYDDPAGLISILQKWKTGSLSNKDWDFARVCVNRNLFENPDCTLQPASSGPEDKPSSLRLSEIKINKNAVTSFSFGAANFKGEENEVLWRVENKSVAEVSPSSGKSVKITPVGLGETKLIITDSTVDNCQISIPIIVNGSSGSKKYQF